MENSERRNIIIVWPVWHFVEMPRFLFSVWINYLKFGINYFSIDLLLKTLLSPWRRYNWQYPRGFDLMEFFNALISNIFSRILGAICRVVLIIIGVVGQVFIFVAGLVLILLWLLIPFIIVFGVLFFILF